MIFGNLEGLISGTEKVIHYSTNTTSTSTIAISGLNGDEDEVYTIIMAGVGKSGDGVTLQFNGDTGNNYGHRSIRALSTTVSNQSSTTTQTIAGEGLYIGYRQLSLIKVYAKSGYIRRSTFYSANPSGPVTISSIQIGGGVWNNTADNMTSMTLSSINNNFAAGSVAIVMKANNFTDGTPSGSLTTPYIKGSWVRIQTNTLSVTQSTISFTSLNGDRDIVYYLSYSSKATANEYHKLTINSDTGNNYGDEILSGVNTTAAGARDVGQAYLLPSYTTQTNNTLCLCEMLIFAKSGFVRPMISTAVNKVSGVVIGHTGIIGHVWSNTADNVTSMELSTSAGYFQPGSQFDLYALRPNG